MSLDRSISKESTVASPNSTRTILENFKAGDLLFGLTGKTRTDLIAALRKKGFTHVVANDLNAPVIDFVLENKELPSNRPLQEKAHYDIMSTKEVKRYLTKPDGVPISAMEDDPRKGVAYRRACKLLANSGNEGRRIHFDLTGIDMNRASKKSPSDNGITNSELRSLYRISRMSGNNSFVFFYNHNLQTLAPWDQPEHKEKWEAYNRYRQWKQNPNRRKRKHDEDNITLNLSLTKRICGQNGSL